MTTHDVQIRAMGLDDYCYSPDYRFSWRQDQLGQWICTMSYKGKRTRAEIMISRGTVIIEYKNHHIQYYPKRKNFNNMQNFATEMAVRIHKAKGEKL
jgi:hypothetical protein